jgi:coiled-coil domain-containing protein 130
MGRYHAPSSLDSSLSSTRTGGFNSQGHPLGARARKLATENALIVRFEMPFRIWCESCKPESIIDQGVRFNAEKKKVGNYYSSAIWSFRMKHTACGGTIEIRTDPQNSKYVVTEGARMRDFGVQDEGEGAFGEILTEEERERRKNDAMAALEGKVKEKQVVKNEQTRVEELLEVQEKRWSDPYTNNQRLRRTFRAEKKVATALQKDREEVAERLGLGFDVLDVTQDDKDRAALVDYGRTDHNGSSAIARTTNKPLFQTKPIHGNEKLPLDTKTKKTKMELRIERKKATLHNEIRENTRAAIDPFLAPFPTSNRDRGSSVIAGLKRKRNVNEQTAGGNEGTSNTRTATNQAVDSEIIETLQGKTAPKTLPTLVAYDSDEE